MPEPKGEESDEGEGGGDMRQNEIDREEKGRESVLPRACQPFYYHDVCAFITAPANKNLLTANRAAATWRPCRTACRPPLTQTMEKQEICTTCFRQLTVTYMRRGLQTDGGKTVLTLHSRAAGKEAWRLR